MYDVSEMKGFVFKITTADVRFGKERNAKWNSPQGLVIERTVVPWYNPGFRWIPYLIFPAGDLR